jgi:hypothetical protein
VTSDRLASRIWFIASVEPPFAQRTSKYIIIVVCTRHAGTARAIVDIWLWSLNPRRQRVNDDRRRWRLLNLHRHNVVCPQVSIDAHEAATAVELVVDRHRRHVYADPSRLDSPRWPAGPHQKVMRVTFSESVEVIVQFESAELRLVFQFGVRNSVALAINLSGKIV